MVVFSCDGCGEMLKKNQVDAHAGRCRRCDSVSCVDCSVSFWGDDYRAHTSCVTESERYEKTTAKPSKRNPQQEWMDMVRSCVSTCPPHLRSYMQTMAGLDNIPRKEKQFRNLASNSLGLRGSNGKIVDGIWHCLMQEREKRLAEKEQNKVPQTQNKQQSQEKAQEETTEASPDENKAISSPTSEGDLGVKMGDVKSSNKAEAKKVKSAAKRALKKAPNGCMKTKALRKLLGKELPLLSKERLKELLAELAKSSDGKVKVDGKMISLAT